MIENCVCVYIMNNWRECICVLALMTFLCICCFNKSFKKATTFRVKIYLFLVLLSTIFVGLNWKQCAEMQFFSSFNGYNIIFIVWLTLILLSIVDVKFTGVTTFNFEQEAHKAVEDNTELMKVLQNKGAMEKIEDMKDSITDNSHDLQDLSVIEEAKNV